MMKKFLTTTVIGLTCLFAGQSAQAAIYNSAVDADSHSNSRSDLFASNFGGNTRLFTGVDAGNTAYSFLRWNLPGDLIGATINSATLTLPSRNVQANAAGDYSLQAYTQQWVEGNGTNTVGVGVSFADYDGTNAWPGADGGFSDRVNVASVNVNYDTQNIVEGAFVDDTTAATTTIFDAKSIVEYWAAGNLNAGLALQQTGSQITMLDIWQRESAGSPVAVLNIDYTVIPEPASLALLGLGGLMILRRRRCA